MHFDLNQDVFWNPADTHLPKGVRAKICGRQEHLEPMPPKGERSAMPSAALDTYWIEFTDPATKAVALRWAKETELNLAPDSGPATPKPFAIELGAKMVMARDGHAHKGVAGIVSGRAQYLASHAAPDTHELRADGGLDGYLIEFKPDPKLHLHSRWFHGDELAAV